MEAAISRVLRDPVQFAEVFFDFHATDYQKTLLRDESKRVAVRWSRQSGKTTTIALAAIWFAVTNEKTLTLIVAPSLRQSMIMGDRIQDYLMGLPNKWRHIFIDKLQRTIVRFRNGARIVILPNSPQLLRGYAANKVICDEAAFFKDDQLVFYNVLYPMLATTDGTLIVSSTPWSKDSVFYKMCQSAEFSKHVITCEDVVKSGLIKQSFLDEMLTQLPLERFQREFMTEFVEDMNAWLTQSLIVTCIDSELEPCTFESKQNGDFHIGVDFGKEQDNSVVVVSQRNGSMIKIVHVHKFPLKTEYASVIGYVRNLQDRWQTIHAVYADVTGVGGYIVEEMVRVGIQHVRGIVFSVQSKEEMATILREKMRAGELKIPYTRTKTREDVDLAAELNIEKCELMKTGHLRFSHPEGAHDDIFWSAALAVYACVQSPTPGRGAFFLPH